MKNKLIAGIAIVALFACKQPCQKIEFDKSRANSRYDGLIIVKTYPDCKDTSNYYYKELEPDSSVVVEGVINKNKKHGEWRSSYFDGFKNIETYANDKLTQKILKDSSDNVIMVENYLNDSIFEEVSYYANGKLKSKGLKRIIDRGQGYTSKDEFGTWLEYDSTGQFEEKGDYLGYPTRDTTYITDIPGTYLVQIYEYIPKVGIWTRRNLITNQIDTID